jgi:hypothetical protein
MITKEEFKSLKQISISKNPEKSKVRILETFKNSTKAQKNEIQELTGFSNFNNYYNAGKTGVASPKVVVSLAAVLDISPKYLTGEIDEKGTCTADDIAEIFKAYGAGGSKKGRVRASKKDDTSEKPAKAPKAAKPAKAAKTAKAAKPAKAVAKATPKAVAKAPKAAKPAKAEVRRAAAPVAAVAKPVAVNSKSVAMEYETLAKLLESLSIRAKYNSGAAETFAVVKELLLK